MNNGHGPCQGTCTNLEGSYECSCSDIPGHKLASDNHTCEDIDECSTSNNGCSHVCLNTPGSAFCLCPDGFYLTSDWKTCQGKVPFFFRFKNVGGFIQCIGINLLAFQIVTIVGHS